MAPVGFSTTFLIAAAVLINFAAAFVPSSVHQGATVGVGSNAASATTLGMAESSSDSYDVVKVDLDDERDYPIYIGAEFDEAEGEEGGHFVLQLRMREIRPRRISCSSYTRFIPPSHAFELTIEINIDPRTIKYLHRQPERFCDHTSREIVL